MPAEFIEDPNVALKWKVYAYINGFWISGNTFYARNDTIAKRFGKSERAVQLALGELEDLCLITRNIKGLSRYILPGRIPQEVRSPASPTHEAQLHQGDEAQLHHISDSIADRLNGAVATAPRVVVKETPIFRGEDSQEEKVPRSTAKYPHAKEVFAWFPRPQKSWESLKNVQEREYAEFLYARGEESVKKMLRYVNEWEENEDFKYVVTKPSDLEKKWEDLRKYGKRNS